MKTTTNSSNDTKSRPLTKKQKITITVCVILSVCILAVAIAVPTYAYKVGFAKSVGTKSYRYTTTDMYVEHDGINLYGKILVPKGEDGQKFPVIIYAHGAGGDWTSDFTTIKSLAMSGFVCYTFDFYGWTENSTGPKGTKWFWGTDFNDTAAYKQQVLEQVKDLDAVIARIKTLDYVDTSNIYLVGSSMGGATVATCATTHSADIKGIVLQYPALFFMTDATVDGAELDVNNYLGPVLILQGAKDSLVTLSMAQELCEHYNKYTLHCTLTVYDNQVHVFDGIYQVKAARDIYNFIASLH